MKNIRYMIGVCALMTGANLIASGANEPPVSPSTAESTSTSPGNSRYGLFNWLDHRSAYGVGVFPEPFLVDDSDLEPNEARFDWLHTRGNGQQSDLATVEFEKGFGLLTVEMELHYERDRAQGETSAGIGNIDLGARYPLYQYVSRNAFVDSTFGVAAEVGVPVNSAVSKNTELVPKIFNDLRVGEHFTLQSILGHSTLFGGGDAGGLQAFEYGFVFGYSIPHRQMPLPYVLEFIPVFELRGETELNKDTPGHNSLLGNLAFRVNLKAVGQVQPRLGVGFVFPIDSGAREDLKWGIVTSLVFQY